MARPQRIKAADTACMFVLSCAGIQAATSLWLCFVAHQNRPAVSGSPLPTRALCLQSPGKLVRQLVQDGEHVQEGQPFAEIEVMKMIQTLPSPAAGVISFQVRPVYTQFTCRTQEAVSVAPWT